MEITEVKVFPIQEEKLKAFVSVVFDQCFMVNDIKVIQGREGLFISMPSRRKKNGEFKDVAHPLNNETRRMIEVRILAEYGQLVSERGDEAVASNLRSNLESSAVLDPSAEASEVPVARTESLAERETFAIAAKDSIAVPQDEGPHVERSLEEVEELHLRDSFWSVR